MTFSLSNDSSHLAPSSDETVHTYVTCYKLKKRVFVLFFKKLTRQLSDKLLLLCKLSFRRGYFQPNMIIFFSYWCVYFDLLFGWECAYACQNLWSKEEGICYAALSSFKNFVGRYLARGSQFGTKQLLLTVSLQLY